MNEPKNFFQTFTLILLALSSLVLVVSGLGYVGEMYFKYVHSLLGTKPFESGFVDACIIVPAAALVFSIVFTVVHKSDAEEGTEEEKKA